jgi:hypothetical protein
MTPRERYNAITNFRRPDKPFVWTFPIRKATMDAWTLQGHPAGISTPELLGYDSFLDFPVVPGHWPQFEKAIVEQKDGHVTYYDEEGALRTDGIADQGSGFVTRQWLKFPVESREDFIRMKERYSPEELGRRVTGYDDVVGNSHTSDRPIMAVILGFYWTMRQWLGFEGLSVAFYDMPDLIDEMMDFTLDFNVRLIRAHFAGAKIDNLYVEEDMAYKTACMVSPALLRDKFLPRYRELIQEARSIIQPDKVFVDSDGHISELIPIWIEAGFDGTCPIEIASEQDLLDYADRHPDFLFMGGIDKRRLLKGKKEVEEEVVPKAEKLYQRLGWIPAVDHAVPSETPFENFQHMIRLLKDMW